MLTVKEGSYLKPERKRRRRRSPPKQKSRVRWVEEEFAAKEEDEEVVDAAPTEGVLAIAGCRAPPGGPEARPLQEGGLEEPGSEGGEAPGARVVPGALEALEAQVQQHEGAGALAQALEIQEAIPVERVRAANGRRRFAQDVRPTQRRNTYVLRQLPFVVPVLRSPLCVFFVCCVCVCCVVV